MGRQRNFTFKTGDLVLVKWSDGMVYFAKIKRIDRKKGKCVVVFDDKSQDEADFCQIHNVDETTTDIICIKCKKDDSDSPNEIVLCDMCGIGFHQKCHNPPIPASALQLDSPWNCSYCQRGLKCPFLTESLDVLQNLLSDNNESATGDEDEYVMESENDEFDSGSRHSGISRKRKGRKCLEARNVKQDRRRSLRHSVPVSELVLPEDKSGLTTQSDAESVFSPNAMQTRAKSKERSPSEDYDSTSQMDSEPTHEGPSSRKRKKFSSSTYQKRLKRSSVESHTVSVTRINTPVYMNSPMSNPFVSHAEEKSQMLSSSNKTSPVMSSLEEGKTLDKAKPILETVKEGVADKDLVLPEVKNDCSSTKIEDNKMEDGSSKESMTEMQPNITEKPFERKPSVSKEDLVESETKKPALENETGPSQDSSVKVKHRQFRVSLSLPNEVETRSMDKLGKKSPPSNSDMLPSWEDLISPKNDLKSPSIETDLCSSPESVFKDEAEAEKNNLAPFIASPLPISQTQKKSPTCPLDVGVTGNLPNPPKSTNTSTNPVLICSSKTPTPVDPITFMSDFPSTSTESDQSKVQKNSETASKLPESNFDSEKQEQVISNTLNEQLLQSPTEPRAVTAVIQKPRSLFTTTPSSKAEQNLKVVIPIKPRSSILQVDNKQNAADMAESSSTISKTGAPTPVITTTPPQPLRVKPQQDQTLVDRQLQVQKSDKPQVNSTSVARPMLLTTARLEEQDKVSRKTVLQTNKPSCEVSNSSLTSAVVKDSAVASSVDSGKTECPVNSTKTKDPDVVITGVEPCNQNQDISEPIPPAKQQTANQQMTISTKAVGVPAAKTSPQQGSGSQAVPVVLSPVSSTLYSTRSAPHSSAVQSMYYEVQTVALPACSPPPYVHNKPEQHMSKEVSTHTTLANPIQVLQSAISTSSRVQAQGGSLVVGPNQVIPQSCMTQAAVGTPIYYTPVPPDSPLLVKNGSHSSSVSTTKPFAFVSALPVPSSDGYRHVTLQKTLPGNRQQLIQVVQATSDSQLPMPPENIVQQCASEPANSPQPIIASSTLPPNSATHAELTPEKKSTRLDKDVQSIQKKIGDAFSSDSETMLVSAFEDAWKKFQENGKKYSSEREQRPKESDIVLAKSTTVQRLVNTPPQTSLIHLMSTKPRVVAPKPSSNGTQVSSGLPGGGPAIQAANSTQQQIVIQPINSEYATVYAIPSSGPAKHQVRTTGLYYPGTEAPISSSIASQSEHNVAKYASQQRGIRSKVSGQVPSASQQHVVKTVIKPSSQRRNPKKSNKLCARCGENATYLCSGCHYEWYCGRECQLKAWEVHSDHCQA